jgi:hypothetical protein
MTSPSARLPVINATIAIAAHSIKISPSVPSLQYLKNLNSKIRSDEKNPACAKGALENASLIEEIFADARAS